MFRVSGWNSDVIWCGKETVVLVLSCKVQLAKIFLLASSLASPPSENSWPSVNCILLLSIDDFVSICHLSSSCDILSARLIRSIVARRMNGTPEDYEGNTFGIGKLQFLKRNCINIIIGTDQTLKNISPSRCSWRAPTLRSDPTASWMTWTRSTDFRFKLIRHSLHRSICRNNTLLL